MLHRNGADFGDADDLWWVFPALIGVPIVVLLVLTAFVAMVHDLLH